MREILVSLLLFSSSCATTSSTMSPELRRSAAAVRLLEGAPPAGFQLLGEISGVSCSKVAGGGPPDIAVAKDEMKLEAARRGGNAVASVVCQEVNFDNWNGCLKSIQCIGDAGRLP